MHLTLKKWKKLIYKLSQTVYNSLIMAILVDYSGVSLATVFSQRTTDFRPDFIRHLILNSLRMYNVKYRDEYGTMVLAVDSGSWRRDVFEHYKAGRRKSREQSTVDWQSVFDVLNEIRDEIRETFPYKVIAVRGAEADDVIGTIIENTTNFGSHEKICVISADKDFVQCQRYKHVKQWSPMTKKSVSHPKPHEYLLEHIFRGDSGDGIPNIKSDDDTFVAGKRQTPVSKKEIQTWLSAYEKDSLESVMTPQQYRNYNRNRTLIDLVYTPQAIADRIIEEYNKEPKGSNSNILNYLIKKRCNQLVACAEDFFAK